MSRRILVVDSEARSLMITSRALETRHYDITMAINSDIGIKQIKEHHFDLVITEFSSSKVDGLAILQTTREKHPNTSVIMMAGIELMPSQTNIFKLGADDYIFRPLQVEELMFRVQRNMEHLDLKQRIDFHGGMIAGCCVCKKIRFEHSEVSGKVEWMAVDDFLKDKVNILLSSTYCPDCIQTVQSELVAQVDRIKSLKKKDSPPY
jgi:response regulator RpfG family c-di-GMP phosphodiesterase